MVVPQTANQHDHHQFHGAADLVHRAGSELGAVPARMLDSHQQRDAAV